MPTRKIALEEAFTIAAFKDREHAMVTHINPKWGAYVKERIADLTDRRLEDMDSAGIDMQVLSLTVPGIQGMTDTGAAISTAKQANDFVAEVVRKYPTRFAAFAALPCQDPAAAGAELKRAVNELGLCDFPKPPFPHPEPGGQAGPWLVPLRRWSWPIGSWVWSKFAKCCAGSAWGTTPGAMCVATPAIAPGVPTISIVRQRIQRRGGAARMAAGRRNRRNGRRGSASRHFATGQGAALKCPKCARAFLIGPDFVADVIASGRSQPGGRAEVRCDIGGHAWWSKHAEALRKARAVVHARRIGRSHP